jgi:hypothetical protein
MKKRWMQQRKKKVKLKKRKILLLKFKTKKQLNLIKSIEKNNG